MSEEDYEGLDGLERDVAKLKSLRGPWREKMKPHFKRWRKKPFPHETTNLCTESGRADAYYNGHLMTIYLHITLFIMIGQTAAIIYLLR